MKKFGICLIGIIMLTLACDKVGFDGKLDSDEYLIFGKYFSECGGNCVTMFMIRNQQLFPDELDWGLPQVIPFSDIPLDPMKFAIAIPLVKSFPNALFESSKRKYGCPDCADQGGFYIRLSTGGNTNTWLIDTRDDEQNKAIIDYKKKIDQVLHLLK